MHEHRTWFPFILVGLTVTLAVMIAAAWQPSTNPVPSATPAFEVIVPPSDTEYQQAVRTVLADYRAGGDARTAYHMLLDLRVPAERKDTHLELVISLSLMSSGYTAEGESRLAVVEASQAWLK